MNSKSECSTLKQRTIQNPVETEGRGLFTGESVVLRFKPAPPHSGIVFDLLGHNEPVRISATVDNVTKRARRTSLRNGTYAIETVEHCLAACTGMEIDNLIIELTGHEVPSLDGSSRNFIDLIQKAGIDTQDAQRELYVIGEMIRVHDNDAELIALPPLPGGGETLEIHYVLDYGPDSPIGYQSYVVRLSPETFTREIASSRTFVLEQEAMYLRSQGLGTHLTYNDIVVYGKNGPIENELRFPEECVRHKILDLIGDLRLLGQMIAGRIYARKSGHALNHELVRRFVGLRRKLKLQDRLSTRPNLDIRQIQRILPHRYPFLLVDRVLEIEGSKRAVGVKNVTFNESFFQGHYPGQPIMPGVLILDAMAQMGGILLSQELDLKGKVAVLISLDKVKFRRPVVPGDQLIIEVEALRVKLRTGHVRCRATVGGEPAAEAIIKFMMADAEP